jgi:hypothetical protein
MIENKSFTKKQNFWNSLLKQKVIFCWKITFSDFLVKIAKKNQTVSAIDWQKNCL